MNAISSKEKKEDIFYKVLFLCFIVYGISTVLLMSLINDFINIWVGEKYLFNNFIVFSILLYVYVGGVNFACYSFRTTSGLFEKAKIVPLIEVILNLVISIVLANFIGTAGVFLGTSIAKFLTFFWTDPVLLYDNLFEKKNIKKYFIKYFRYLFTTLMIGGLMFLLSGLIAVNNYFAWFMKAIVLGILTLLLFILFTYKSFEFKYIINLLEDKLPIKIKKFIKKENI